MLRIAFLQKLAGLSREEFSRHWRGQHAQLAAGVPHFWRRNARYVQNHVVASWPAQAATPWDGIVEMHEHPGAEALHHLREDPEFLARVEPDERKFLRQDQMMRLGVTSRTLVDGAASGRKFLTLLRRPSGVAADEFAAWLAHARVQHARALLPAAAIERWELHTTVPGSHSAWSDHPGYDAVESVFLRAVVPREAAMHALHASLQGPLIDGAEVHAVEAVPIPRPSGVAPDARHLNASRTDWPTAPRC